MLINIIMSIIVIFPCNELSSDHKIDEYFDEAIQEKNKIKLNHLVSICINQNNYDKIIEYYEELYEILSNHIEFIEIEQLRFLSNE